MKKRILALIAVAVTLGVLATLVLQVGTASACALGLSPGYWKNHTEAWAGTGYSPEDTFNGVFGVGPSITLMSSLRLRGGGEAAFDRMAVASLLNANSVPDALEEFYVQQEVTWAYAYGDWEAAKDYLESFID